MIITAAADGVAPGGAGGGPALLIILAVIGLLIAKEVSSSLMGERARRLSQGLNVLIIPLLTLFLVTVTMRLLGAPH